MQGWGGTLTMAIGLVLLGCGGDDGVAPAGPPPVIRLVTGGGQTTLLGFPVSVPIVVRVESAEGEPLANQRLLVATDAPFASATGTAAATATDGTFPIAWRTGAVPGTQRLTISLPGHPGSTPLVVEALAESRPVLGMGGGMPSYCVIGLDGALGCFAPARAGDHPPTLVPAAGSERFRAIAIYATEGPASPGCAVTQGGRIWCFAVDTLGQVGALRELAGAYPAMKSVHAGGIDRADDPPFCALAVDETAWCWGGNASGVLGDGTRIARTTPVPVHTALRFTDLAVGSRHACGIAVGGNAWCWGDNDFGQLGLAPPGGVIPSPVPVDPDLRFARIAVVREDVTCGIGTGGGLRCWGNKDRLGLGDLAATVDGSAITRPTAPLDVLASLAVATLDSAVVTAEAEGRGSWWGVLSAPTELLRAERARPFDQPLPFGHLLIPVSHGALCGASAPGAAVICVRVGALTGYDFADRSPALRVFGVPA